MPRVYSINKLMSDNQCLNMVKDWKSMTVQQQRSQKASPLKRRKFVDKDGNVVAGT